VPGTSISFPDGASITVPANGSQTFRVQLNMDAAAMKHSRNPSMAATQLGYQRQYLAEVTGLVIVDPTSSPDPSLRVPLYATVRPASQMRATQSSVSVSSPTQSVSVGLTGTGVSTGGAASVDHRSIVSAFELQAASPAMPAGASTIEKAGDLRYVGVASDARSIGTISGSMLYFGVATDRNWLRPSSDVVFSVLIDTNRDGTFDYELYNTALYNGNDATDVVVTSLYSVATDTSTPVSFLNLFDSTVPTAIFDNNVLVLPVPADALAGLTVGNSRFNYVVNVFYGNTFTDSSGMLTYDLLKPGVDVFTAPGQTPMFWDTNGGGITAAYSQADYQANKSLGLLLLHHYNQNGQRAEVVTISAALQSQTVAFAAGSPTSKAVGDTPFTVSATASSGLPVTIASQTPAICTISPTNVVSLVAAGLCTLRATQAGDATYQPATADLSLAVAPATVPTEPTVEPGGTPPTVVPGATPLPTECSPRPNVRVTSNRLASGQFLVTVTAGRGTLQTIRFGYQNRGLQNVSIHLVGNGGTQQISEPTIVTLPDNTTSQAFTVTQTVPGQSATVPMIVVDGCGAWETLVGVGNGG
jgi:hypothetical protein